MRPVHGLTSGNTSSCGISVGGSAAAGSEFHIKPLVVLFGLGRIKRGRSARRHRLWAPRLTNADIRRLPPQTQELQHARENAWLSLTFHATTLRVDPLVEPLRYLLHPKRFRHTAHSPGLRRRASDATQPGSLPTAWSASDVEKRDDRTSAPSAKRGARRREDGK